MTEPQCTCDQHGDFCLVHPPCACGCQRHAHGDGGCITGSLNCHGCVAYRPAQTKIFHELFDEQLEQITLEGLREEYKAFRTHHIEETTALWHRLKVATSSTKP